jgi:ferredoxin
MKAKVDPDLCTACELCVETCPAVFEMGDDVAVVKAEEVPADARECCRQAAEDCPVEAIAVEE